MKKMIALLIILPAVILAACAPQQTQTPPSLSQPAEETAAPYDERLIYHSKDEFYKEVNKAKDNKVKKGDKTHHKIEEIEYYYDFKNPVKDVELDSVNVTYRYVYLDYRDKEAKESDYLTLKCDRVLYESEEQYLEYYSVLHGLSETVINGHKALKGEEYWDDPFTTEVENVYTSNRYFWTEDGTAIFLRIPAWLLERYPEETFFDIQKVKIEKLTQDPPSSSPPAEETAAPDQESLTYHSKDEFINEVNKAKEAYEKTGEKTYHEIEGIDAYYDFKEPVKNVKLDSVNVTSSYITLDYRDKEAKESGSLILKCDRPIYEDEEQYLEQFRSLSGMVETMINNHKALKVEENWDDPMTTEVENIHVGNKYFWVENGTGMFLRIPAWLLERYPEGTFFDIREVEIEKPDETK